MSLGITTWHLESVGRTFRLTEDRKQNQRPEGNNDNPKDCLPVTYTFQLGLTTYSLY